ncbi:peroxisomal membrane protein 11B isoform X2 [Callorhinchus milii]|uniref:peroxisomal membrane protein 11B isoform X2 n=1 Tax=Callorhinchus milii TaxID=7868 RepID=UPI001C3F7A86|nr:peroxisomal membrane protein 11B isoform X2 [Callorhinchus milii]
MEPLINLISLSRGRDRIFRTTQYACALLHYLIPKQGSGKELSIKLQQLEANMSAGRKLLRLGSSVDAVQAARRSAVLRDPVLRLCLTGVQLSRAVSYLCDNVVWLCSVGAGLDREAWSRCSSRWYLLSLGLSLSRDLYQLVCLLRQAGKEGPSPQLPLSTAPTWAQPVDRVQELVTLLYRGLRDNPPLLLDLTKNLCDLPLPLDKLDVYRSSTGLGALCGLLSSLLSLLTLTHPPLRLQP